MLTGAAGQLGSALCGKLLPRFLRDHVWPWLRSRRVPGPGSGRQEERATATEMQTFLFLAVLQLVVMVFTAI